MYNNFQSPIVCFVLGFYAVTVCFVCLSTFSFVLLVKSFLTAPLNVCQKASVAPWHTFLFKTWQVLGTTF